MVGVTGWRGKPASPIGQEAFRVLDELRCRSADLGLIHAMFLCLVGHGDSGRRRRLTAGCRRDTI
jgi:hypothetical protein